MLSGADASVEREIVRLYPGNTRANNAMDQTLRRAALASLLALVIAGRWAVRENESLCDQGFVTPSIGSRSNTTN